MPRYFLLTGCSGAGKSTVLDALSVRGAETIAEPGRRIVQREQACGGGALPWVNMQLFADAALALAVEDLRKAETQLAADVPVFCDRGLIDAALALERLGSGTAESILAAHPRYEETVFLFEPWRELYRTDAERQHGFDAALDEYESIASALPELGYTALTVPQRTPEQRAEFILSAVDHAEPPGRFRSGQAHP